MNKNNNISGIFSNLLKSCANWFLYIFIAPDAELPKAIMDKRKRQIDFLVKIDKWNTYYNYNELVSIVRAGIIERYGMQPNEVLQKMYDTITALNSNVGTLPGVTVTGGASLPNITSQGVTNLNNLAVKTTSGQTVNVWKDIASVIEWLVQLVKSLGLGSNRNEYAGYTPQPEDWYKVEKSSMGGSLPFVVGGVILYYLFTNNSDGKPKTKK